MEGVENLDTVYKLTAGILIGLVPSVKNRTGPAVQPEPEVGMVRSNRKTGHATVQPEPTGFVLNRVINYFRSDRTCVRLVRGLDIFSTN
jgi:hypothetical protein